MSMIERIIPSNYVAYTYRSNNATKPVGTHEPNHNVVEVEDVKVKNNKVKNNKVKDEDYDEDYDDEDDEDDEDDNKDEKKSYEKIISTLIDKIENLKNKNKKLIEEINVLKNQK